MTKNKKQKGFTLIEIMVSILFITVAIISLTSLTIGSIILHDNIEQKNKASNTATMILNEYSVDPLNLPAAVISGLPKRNGFSWTLTPIVIDPLQTLLSVKLTWPTRLNKTKEITVNRIITKAIGAI